MENSAITKLILAFVILILGVVLIGPIANNTNLVVDKTFTSETLTLVRLDSGSCPMSIDTTEEYTLSNAPNSGWQADNGCVLGNLAMRNQTDVSAVETTDYVAFLNNGTMFLKNTTKFLDVECTNTINTTTVDYDYCPDGYLNIGWGRNIIDLVSGFFALALLLVSVALFYSIGKILE